MSIEKPFVPSELPESNLEDQEKILQDKKEAENTRFFFENVVLSRADLTDAQKDAIKQHIESQPGQWREVNGEDVKVVEVVVEPNKLRFVILLEEFGNEVEDEIAF